MKEDLNQLIKEFKKIRERGWIKSLRKGTSGAGYTFETLINKHEDNLDIPDYGMIEIKTKQKFDNCNIKLFCITPDGDISSPIQYIKEKFGYPDEDLREYLIFNGEVKSKEFLPIGQNYLYKLEVDYINEKLRLIVIDYSYNLVSKDISWSFKLLKEKLEKKLQYLAVIKVRNRVIHGETHYKYEWIEFYHLKGFKDFIKLIEDGYISIKFSIGVFKGEYRHGQIHDHGTQFTINEKDLKKLYNSIIVSYKLRK